MSAEGENGIPIPPVVGEEAQASSKATPGRMARAGKAVLPLAFLVPAALTCLGAGFMASQYSPLVFDASQYQAHAQATAVSADDLKTKVVDESKRTTNTQSADQKAKAEGSKNFTMTEPAGGYKDGVYTASSYGYRSYITVQVTIKNGKIAGIKVLSEDEDRPYYTNATAVIDRVLSKQSTNVDTVSGATYSSRGILAAVKKCLQKAAVNKKAQKPVKENKPAKQEEDEGDDGDSITIDPPKNDDADNGEDADARKLYADGTWEGSGDGYAVKVDGEDSPIVVKVTTKSDYIVGIEIVSHSEDNPYWRYASKGKGSVKSVPKQIITKQTADVDAVSGATYSSNGIMAAVKDALAKAKAALEEQKKADADKDADTGKDDGASDDKVSGKGDEADNGDGAAVKPSEGEPEPVEGSGSDSSRSA